MLLPAQLEFALPPRNSWGSRRAGAGRKPGPRPRVPHLRRAAFSEHTPCHVTLRVLRGVPSLRDGRVVREVERSFRVASERGSFRVVQYSLQRDHVHLLVEARLAPEDPPVASARTWLLRVGWFRHGRIDPAEIPGRRG